MRKKFIGSILATIMIGGVLVGSYETSKIKNENHNLHQNLNEIKEKLEITEEEVDKQTKVQQELQKEIDSLDNDKKSLNKEIKSLKEALSKKKKENQERVKRKITVKVTGYCPCSYCCGEWAYKNPGITASGTRARTGTIAAPKSIPFGTKMKIQGYGNQVFTVEDTGSAVIESNGVYVIDMWMPTHSQAYAIGNKIVQAEIIN